MFYSWYLRFLGLQTSTRCTNGCVVECRICNREVAVRISGWVTWPKVCSAFHPSRVGKWVPAAAGKAKAGVAHSDCGWTCGCEGKTVRSLENARHTWVLLRWCFTTKRRYIKCMHLMHIWDAKSLSWPWTLGLDGLPSWSWKDLKVLVFVLKIRSWSWCWKSSLRHLQLVLEQQFPLRKTRGVSI